MINISIIIPAYNRALTINYCINSILQQTYQKFEVIVVDDCSSDNTVEVVRNINDNRIRVIQLNKNSGAQVARNEGIRNAKYNWIAFNDSDDEWLLNKLERQLEELQQVNFDQTVVIHGNCYKKNHTTNEQTAWELPLTEGECYSKLLTTNSILFPSIVVSKHALQKIGYLDPSVPSYQEWDTAIRLAKYCKFVHIKEPLFVYHLHENDTISKNKLNELIGYQYVINKFETEIIENCGIEAWHNHLNIQLYRLAHSHFIHKISNNASDHFFESLNQHILHQLDIAKWQTNELVLLEKKYQNLRNSLSYRIGNILVAPFSMLKQKLWNK